MNTTTSSVLNDSLQNCGVRISVSSEHPLEQRDMHQSSFYHGATWPLFEPAEPGWLGCPLINVGPLEPQSFFRATVK